MIKNLFFTLLCLFTLKPKIADALNLEKFHLVNECDIFNIEGTVIKSFPGSACLFLSNGSFLSSTMQEIKFINKDSSVAWSLKNHFHHQMNESLDHKNFLIMSSNVLTQKHGLTREDKLMIIDHEGKVIHSTTSSDIYQQLTHAPFLREAEPMLKELLNVTHEITHFNSFYEIPPNKLENKLSYMKAGNFIVNGREDGIFFLSPDLKRVLHFLSYKGSFNHRIHDVQVLPSGNLLLFNNFVAGFDRFHRQSAIQEISPATQKVLFNYQAKPAVFFFVSTGGSVQKLDDNHYLFADSLVSTHIYSKIKKNIIVSLIETHIGATGIRPTFQVKASDLSSFLSYWKK